MADLRACYGNLALKNPMVLAAAGTTLNVDLIKRAEENGAAAVVMKTLFEEETARRNPTPCFAVIRRKGGPMRSTTFYSFEQASPWGPDRYAEEIHRACREVDIPVIASINCVTDEAWTAYARTVEQAGAGAIELNRSCPYSTILLSGQDAWTALAAETVKIVKSAVSIPVCAKFTPQLTDPLLSAKYLAEAGADGVVMFSRFTGLEIDVETERPIMHQGFAGHGGTWALHYALRWIAAASPDLAIPISASGGVCCGDDVIKFILAGATSVQLCTAVYMEGFKVIRRYLGRLEEFMERKGYTALEDFRGAVCGRIIPSDRVDRRRLAAALIDAEQCSECGTCARVCLHQAVDRVEGAYRVNSACAGCGLCHELCPERAIIMAGVAGS